MFHDRMLILCTSVCFYTQEYKYLTFEPRGSLSCCTHSRCTIKLVFQSFIIYTRYEYLFTVHSTKEKCESLTLDSKDVNLFKQLRNMGTRLNDALKLSRKRKGFEVAKLL